MLALIMNVAAKGLTSGSATNVQRVVLGPSLQDLNPFEHRFHSLEDLNNENPLSLSLMALLAVQHDYKTIYNAMNTHISLLILRDCTCHIYS